MCPKVSPISIRLGKHSNMLWGKQPTAFFFGFNSTKFSILLARFLLHVFYKKKIQLVDFIFNQVNTVSKLFLVIYKLFYRKKRYHIPLGSFSSFFFFYFKRKRRHMYAERRRWREDNKSFFLREIFDSFASRQCSKKLINNQTRYYNRFLIKDKSSYGFKNRFNENKIKMLFYSKFKLKLNNKLLWIFKFNKNSYRKLYKKPLLASFLRKRKFLRKRLKYFYRRGDWLKENYYYLPFNSKLKYLNNKRLTKTYRKIIIRRFRFILNIFNFLMSQPLRYNKKKSFIFILYLNYLKKKFKFLTCKKKKRQYKGNNKSLYKKKKLVFNKINARIKSIMLKKRNSNNFVKFNIFPHIRGINKKYWAFFSEPTLQRYIHGIPKNFINEHLLPHLYYKILILNYYRKNLYKYILVKRKMFILKNFKIYPYLIKKKKYFLKKFYYNFILNNNYYLIKDIWFLQRAYNKFIFLPVLLGFYNRYLKVKRGLELSKLFKFYPRYRKKNIFNYLNNRLYIFFRRIKTIAKQYSYSFDHGARLWERLVAFQIKTKDMLLDDEKIRKKTKILNSFSKRIINISNTLEKLNLRRAIYRRKKLFLNKKFKFIRRVLRSFKIKTLKVNRFDLYYSTKREKKLLEERRSLIKLKKKKLTLVHKRLLKFNSKQVKKKKIIKKKLLKKKSSLIGLKKNKLSLTRLPLTKLRVKKKAIKKLSIKQLIYEKRPILKINRLQKLRKRIKKSAVNTRRLSKNKYLSFKLKKNYNKSLVKRRNLIYNKEIKKYFNSFFLQSKLALKPDFNSVFYFFKRRNSVFYFNKFFESKFFFSKNAISANKVSTLNFIKLNNNRTFSFFSNFFIQPKAKCIFFFNTGLSNYYIDLVKSPILESKFLFDKFFCFFFRNYYRSRRILASRRIKTFFKKISFFIKKYQVLLFELFLTRILKKAFSVSIWSGLHLLKIRYKIDLRYITYMIFKRAHIHRRAFHFCHNFINLFYLSIKFCTLTGLITFFCNEFYYRKRQQIFLNAIDRVLRYWERGTLPFIGFSMLVSGKLKRRPRARRYFLRLGNKPRLSYFELKIQYASRQVVSSFGVYGIKMWLYYL